MTRMALRTPAKPPLWAERVRALRLKLRLSQAELGKKLDCTSMSVSRWERGEQKPPTGCLLALGKMVGPPAGWFFWNEAGITTRDARRMLNSFAGNFNSGRKTHH